jgi:hypothetical protein
MSGELGDNEEDGRCGEEKRRGGEHETTHAAAPGLGRAGIQLPQFGNARHVLHARARDASACCIGMDTAFREEIRV